MGESWGLPSPSDGTLNGAPCPGKQPSWYAKERFTGFRRRVLGS